MLAVALLAACGDSAAPDDKPNPVGGVAVPSSAKADGEPKRAPHDVITAELLREHTKALSDDAMQGRRPGTPGGRRAIEYIVTSMKDLGLEPAAGEDFTQRVLMRAVATDGKGVELTVTGGKGKPRTWAFGPEFVGGSYGAAGTHAVDAPLVFAGYGITAPEHEWDDYADLDAKGKIVVVLVGDPPLPDDRFGGPALTYYGRWSYKFERALEAGAAGCLVVHEDEPASYGWNVVETSWSSERFTLTDADGELPPALGIQGWISRDTADDLARRAGTSLDGWHKQAVRPGFRAVGLPMRLQGSLPTSERYLSDSNVVGRIPGADLAHEAVVLTAHWDHLGTDVAAGESGDAIYNGAIDNASGVAMILAVADRDPSARPRRHTAPPQRHLRRHHGRGAGPARQPLLRRATAGAALVDRRRVQPRQHERRRADDGVEVVGAGQSSLEDVLAEVVRAQGRRVVPDSRPGSGGYYRSDHFPFAKKGIPALYFHAAFDMEDGGEEAGARLARERSRRYHTVDDEFVEAWTFAGAEQDAEAVMDVVLKVADGNARPQWRPTSEFAQVRPGTPPG